MKKLLFSLFIACFAVVLVKAQDVPKKATSFGWSKTSLAEIGCDVDQIKKITAIKKEASEKKAKIEADAALDEKAKKAAIKVIVKDRNEAMNALLTEEQRKKVQDINNKLKEEAKAANGN